MFTGPVPNFKKLITQFEKKLVFLLRRLAGKKEPKKMHIIDGKENYRLNFKENPNHKIYTPDEANDIIAELISDKKPLLLSRLGTVELSTLLDYLTIQKLNKLSRLQIYSHIFKTAEHPFWTKSNRNWMNRNAGLFPVTDEMLVRFSKLYLELIEQINVLGLHSYSVGVHGETFLVNHYGSTDTVLCDIQAFSPFQNEKPWTQALKGKKVLIIHPFHESIQNNYLNKEKIFPNEFLPKFQLRTYRPVQSIAGNKTGFKTWFDALKYMENQIRKIDFDIALIAAGAYGLPLANFIKISGKKALHIGGILQLFFGIRGKRWDNDPVLKNIMNSSWTRPMPEEIPQNHNLVEEGCYW